MSLLRSKPAQDDAIPGGGPSSLGQHFANLSRYVRAARSFLLSRLRQSESYGKWRCASAASPSTSCRHRAPCGRDYPVI